MDISAYAILYLLVFRLAIIACGIVSIVLGYKLFVKGVYDQKGGGNTGMDAELGEIKFTLKNAAPGTVFALFGVIIISVMFAKGAPEFDMKSVNEKPVNIKVDSIENPNNIKKSTETLIDTIKEETEISRLKNNSPENSTPDNNFELLLAKLNHMENKITALDKMQEAVEKMRYEIKIRGEQDANKNIQTFYQVNSMAKESEDERDFNTARNLFSENVNAMAYSLNGLAWRYFEDKNFESAKSISEIAIKIAPESSNYLDTYAEILYATKDYNGAVKYMEKAVDLDPTDTYKAKLQKFKTKI